MPGLAQQLSGIPGTTLAPAAETAPSLPLPPAHSELLAQANGVLAFHGYLRLFGAGQEAPIGLEWWNDSHTWKFAWASALVEPYLCFGGNAWGDQYAYLRSEGEAVYLLDAYGMEAEKIADSFEEFFRDEFLRCAREPYDAHTLVAHRRCGPLAWSQHVIQAPPFLIAGELPEAAVVMPARTVMIFNGDVATQLDAAEDSAVVESIRPYKDKFARDRLQLVWAG